ncbi:thioredoxin reductase [Bacillus oleivorans]|uniref:Thioredoxin reductase n=1 Tax=Bacillus oleivorans TaxID=1448271 RepID=A0A285D589_9BACI|nr:FAD-dependent oxidoreductase [Bacillus oleivorans]SNX74967.1 thioredoxin reductase [Bacillus oleivorans]
MNYDLIIIGAGPAGISAGIKAAEYGAKVVIVDENPTAGGKLLGQLHEEPNQGWWIGRKVAESMVDHANRLGITFLLEREVWGLYPKWTVKLNKGEELTGPFVLIATGAAEKATPIPGWTLPGVMAIGAAQVINNYYRVRTGKKVAIIGINPLSFTVAHELQLAGTNVVGIFIPPINDFSDEASNPKQIIFRLSNLAHLAPNFMLKIAGQMAKNPLIQVIGAQFFPYKGVKIWDIPLHLRKTVVEIRGSNKVEQIIVRKINRDGLVKSDSFETLEVDCVCISGGLYPLAELASLAGCKFAYIEELGGHVPIHSAELETTREGIFVAGNIIGIEGAKVAMAQGELAGLSISNRLGRIHDAKSLIKEAQDQVQEVRRNALIKFLPSIEQGKSKMHQLWNQNVINT